MKTLEEQVREKMLATTQPRELSDVQMEAVTSAVSDWYREIFEKDVPHVWDGTHPPGGYVCSICGTPTESEPCEKHQGAAFGSMS
ncbi:hypothetical protein SEA_BEATUSCOMEDENTI_89 [Arthrobacter phage BeatusComedenti]|uniref:Uncharacterized protein n=1 Tax=Arthrobacter phage BeatusComedenti TaxID=2656523 RepID=A0A649VW87_9CAUD|nr:hypothetical protein SEA_BEATUSCOMEDENTI_89 [Arthrobacter phage BeatusComedenti]